uniref:Uncharacterized mitochondrial protein AtMg00810-like n=1 Tax=Nicotiana tabacum TaxID=4097 RepID=A0A1S4C4P9_TOBAC|nr:PREDICTED: uncharacterized mitochondrial protein AtMg00810-like [Nicotiana tabacum]
MVEEYNALMTNNTWQLVLPPPNANVIGCRWVYRVKQRSDGSIERFKARLVAHGPVVKPVTIHTVLALAASKGWLIHQLNVKNAFLHGTLNELSKYIQDLLSRANLLFSKPVSIPFSSKESLHTSDSPPFSNPTLYRSLVGGLQYLTFTRPNIPFAVNQVSQFMHSPLEVHYTAVKCILRYLNGSLSHGLFIRGGSIDHLICYSDADWAGCPSTRRSTSAVQYVNTADQLADLLTKPLPSPRLL